MVERDDYQDTVYEFAGLWGAPSCCGLKIVRKEDRDVVIVTDLYDSNPGTSVTSFCGELATILVEAHELDLGKLVFVHRCPDKGSRLEFYAQTFDLVSFERRDGAFTSPSWKRVQKKEVDALLAD